MTKKEEKRLQRRKQALKTVVIPYVFGIAMLVLGIVGLIGAKSDYDQYHSAEDVRRVEATATYVEIKSIEDPDRPFPQTLWYTDVTYEVDGKSYNGMVRLEKEIRAGETVSVEVYPAKDGSWKIPEYTTEEAKGWSDILMCIALGVGLLVTCASTFYLVDELRKSAPKKGSNPSNPSADR